jgi:predicted transcriptional regulator
VTKEVRPNTIFKILETALCSNGATFTKLLDKSDLSEYPDRLKVYLSILGSNGFIAYHEGDRVYKTTYKVMLTKV